MNPKFKNITDRQTFDIAIDQLAASSFVVADTETNGLKYYLGNYIISISIYLPEFDTGWNFPFRHGDGRVNPRYNKHNTSLTPFADMNWTGNAKKDLFLQWAFDEFKATRDPAYFYNLPEEWLQDLKDNWALEGVTYLFHNARFDLHMLAQEGFPTPTKVLDTMLMLHLVHEDWGGVEVDAPYKNDVGMWARTDSGDFLKKKQYANRQLKWLARFWGFEDAEKGEEELTKAKTQFEEDLASHIMLHKLNSPMCEGLRYARYSKNSMSMPDILKELLKDDEWADKQLDRIQKKINLHPKANMWMLSSRDVWYYAVLDTKLTYDLYCKLMPILEDWDNVDLFHNVCDIQLHVAWVMECNGLKVDTEEVHRQMQVHTPQRDEIAAILQSWGKGNGYTAEISLGSTKKLLPDFIRWAVQRPFDMTFMPDWIDPKQVAKMDNTPHDVGGNQLTKTNKEALEPFKYHPVVQLLLEWRKLNKTLDTYLANWVSSATKDGIVNGSMNVDGTVAGRFSSSGRSGNIQNVPDRRGYRVKKAFVSYGEDWLIFAIDYGQLEARIAAWIAEILLPQQGAYSIAKPTMVDLFNSGEDMHSYVRDMVGVREIMYTGLSDSDIAYQVGINPALMTEEKLHEYIMRNVCRQVAKTLNFGLLYSGTHKMVSKLLRIPEAHAKELVNRWRKLFPAFELAQLHYEDISQTWRKPPNSDGRAMYATQPITGRHRKMHKYPVWRMYWEDGVRKGFNPRQANARKVWNNVVQGLSGWMSVDSALRYQTDHTWEGMKLFAQIHDALDGQVKVTELERVKTLMGYMVDYPTNPVLTVDLEAGYNWQPASKDNPQGLKTVHDVNLWIATRGQQGYETS